MALDPPAQPNRPPRDRLLNNEVLRYDEALVSPDGKYKLTIQDNQNLILRDNENNKIWESNTWGRAAWYLRMKPDGNLVLCDPQDEEVWDSKTFRIGNETSMLIVKNQGTIVINSRGREIWTRPIPKNPAPPVVSPPKPAPNPSPAPANTSTPGTSQPPVVPLPKPEPSPSAVPATTTTAGASQPASGSTTTTATAGVSQPASGSTTTVASGTPQVTPASVANPSANPPAVAARPVLCVRGGQSLTVNERIYSPSGKVWASFQDDGNFVVRTVSEVLHKTDTNGKGIKTATLRTNGEFSMSDKDQKQQWSSGSSGKEARDTVLLVQDDGHAVILSGGTRVWRTPCRKQPGFDKDRLNAEEYLDIEQRIVSQNGFYYMALSKSGIFYLEETLGAQRTLWTNNTERIRGPEGKRIMMRGDDDLWVGEGESFSWSSTTRRRSDRNGNAALIVGDNAVGTVQIDGLIVWSSDPKKVPTSYHEAQQITPLATGRDRLRPGEYLPLNGTFWSKNEQFAGQMMDSNNFHIHRKGSGGVWECLWSTKTGNTMVSKACLDWTGRFVLYGIGSKPVFETPTANSRGEVELVLQNDGNLVLSRDGSPAWSSQVAFPASIQTVDRIKWGEWLSIDQSLTSQNGLYTLTLKDNANFGIKKKDGESMYTNSAKGQTGSRLLHFNRDSNDLEIYDSKGKPLGGFGGKILWSAAPGNNAARGIKPFQDAAFIIGDDGNAVLILSGKVLWESKNNGAPLPKS